MVEEKTVLINNLKTNFKATGAGPVILILHGWGASSNSWSKVQDILAGKGYRVICPDFPGFGKSKAPEKPWDVSDYAQWVIEFIQSQNIDKFSLIAHSFGGRVAVKLSAKYPQKIESLIFCSSAGIKHEPDLQTKGIYEITRLGNKVFAQKFLSNFKDKAKNVLYFFLRRKDYARAKGVMRKTLQRVLKEDLLSYLSKIRTKTLIIWGEDDKYVPIKDAHTFKEKIEGSKLEILLGAGHSPHFERPGRLAEIIFNFLKAKP